MEESKTTGTPRDPAEIKAELAANGASNGDKKPEANGDASPAVKSPEKGEEPVAGPSVSPSKKDVQVVNRAMQYLAAGKRDLLIQDPTSAVASLAQSCELLGEHYGETAPECGEAYYYYGRALLDLARVEAGVIDNVLDGVPEDEKSEEEDSTVEDPEKCSEEEKEKVAEDVGRALEENYEELEKMKKLKEKEAKLLSGGEIEITDRRHASAEVKKESDPVPKEGAEAGVEGKDAPEKAGKDSDGKDAQGSKKESENGTKGESGDVQMKSEDSKDVKADDEKEASLGDVGSASLGEASAGSGGEGAKEESDSKGKGDEAEKPGVQEDGGDVEMKPADESEENSAEDEEEEEEEKPDGENKEEEEEEKKEGEEGEEEGEEEGKDESIASDTEANTAAKDTGDAAAVEKEEEEDPSNLQLAWEMLELAKTIFIKQVETMKEETEKEREAKFNVSSRICDTYQTLGELSIENENYEQAIEDLRTCLERRRKLLPEDSRLIAETHYQLGVAEGFSIRFDEAVESLMSAIAVLEKRVENLKAEKESKDPAKKNDAFYTREGEIKELEGLIPEIREKIADTKDMKEETRKKLGDRRLMEEEICSAQTVKSSNGTANGEGSSSKTVSTLQVKKRKKSGEDKVSEAKKPHVETSNGHGPSTSK